MSSNKFEKYYDIEDFSPEAHNLLSEFTCPLCSGVYKDPVLDQCGHVFCKKCLMKVVDITGTCPLTSMAVSKDKIFVMDFILRQIEKQFMYCKNKREGCTWENQCSQLQNHLDNECTKQLVTCTNNKCGIQSHREDFEDHLSNCSFKQIECPSSCGKMVKRNSLQKHSEKCPNTVITCSQGCESKIVRKDLTNHLQDFCVNSLINCTLKSAGCEVKGSRAMVQKHSKESSDEHLMLVYNRLLLIEQNFSNEIKSIKEKLNNNNNQISAGTLQELKTPIKAEDTKKKREYTIKKDKKRAKNDRPISYEIELDNEEHNMQEDSNMVLEQCVSENQQHDLNDIDFSDILCVSDIKEPCAKNFKKIEEIRKLVKSKNHN